MNKETISKIVKASGIQEGELVLLHFWGELEHLQLLTQFSEAVVSLGASPLELLQSRSRNQKIFTSVRKECFNEKYFFAFKEVDTVLDIFTYRPVVLGAELEENQMEFYKTYMRNLFGTLGQVKRFLQIRIPTEENAMESGLETTEYIARMEKAYDIDYDLLKEKCLNRKEELNQFTAIQLTTGKGNHLHIDYTGRDWYLDTGEGDMPCGEVYIAPLEDKTEGTVYFEKLYVEDLGVYENAVLYIHKGIVEKSSCHEVNEFLQRLNENDRTICELGFGMNENVTELTGYTVLDEKMYNTFHIAIGDNTMFGGKNQAQLHMDFIGKAMLQMIQ